MKKDPSIARAEALRVIMNMPEYERTIGAWIKEAHLSALHNMTQAKETHDFLSSQGAYNAINALSEQFDKVFAAEKVALSKLNKKKDQ
jgi:hypothetical protein